MPTIRTARLTDIVPLIAFLRNDSHQELTASHWPNLWGDSSARIVRDLLSRLIARPGRSEVWVSHANGGVQGLAIAQQRSGKLAWDVENLFTAAEERPASVDLLDHLCVEAARRGARRVFLTTPADPDAARTAKQAGFVNFTAETLYSVRLTGAVDGDGLPQARPRLRQDTHALFQLYSAAVPCSVRIAEAMTLDEWSSLDRGSKPWAPSLGGTRQHSVWEAGGTLAGWLRLTFGARSQHISLLIHPSHRAATEDMVAYSLSQASHKVPIYVSVRDYQPEIASELLRRGFTRAVEYLIFARELAARVPNRAFVPVRA